MFLLSSLQLWLQYWNFHSSLWSRWVVLPQYLSAGGLWWMGRVQHQGEWRDSVLSLWTWILWRWRSSGHVQWPHSAHWRFLMFSSTFICSRTEVCLWISCLYSCYLETSHNVNKNQKMFFISMHIFGTNLKIETKWPQVLQNQNYCTFVSNWNSLNDLAFLKGITLFCRWWGESGV